MGCSIKQTSHIHLFFLCVFLSLEYFSTHAGLVERQLAAKREKAGLANRDEMWQGDIAKETDQLVTGDDSA